MKAEKSKSLEANTANATLTSRIAGLEAEAKDLNELLEESKAARSADAEELEKRMEDIKRAAAKELALTKKGQCHRQKTLQPKSNVLKKELRCLWIAIACRLTILVAIIVIVNH